MIRQEEVAFFVIQVYYGDNTLIFERGANFSAT